MLRRKDDGSPVEAPPTDRQGMDLLLPFLRGDDERVRSLLLASRPSETDFLGFLRRHGLAGFLMAEIQGTELSAPLPPALGSALRSAQAEQWARNVALLSPMRELHTCFGAQGVEHLFLKGPLFGLRCYGDLDRRVTGDIDLLVRRADVGRAEALLVGLGFAHIARPMPGRRLTMRFTHHFELSRDATVVELHWTLARHPGVRLSEEVLWEGWEHQRHEGASFPVPSLETSLLCLLIGLATDLGLGVVRLRSLFDVLMLLRALPSDFSWSRFAERRRVEGGLGLSLGLLDLTLELLGARQEFPALEAAIDELGSGRRARALGEIGLDDFRARPPAWGNKSRVFELLEPSNALCWGWWLGSLPLRVLAHRPG